MLREIFSWKGLKSDVINYFNEFPTCHKNNVEHTHPAGLLHPLLIPEQKWESIFMDFIIGLSKVFGKDCIFVVVDRLTKSAHFFAILPLSMLYKWMNYFLKKFSDCMGFLRALLVTGIAYFLVHFGKNSSK